MNLAPMIIDSFAGGGGASTGIEMALGRSLDVAINHSAAALALHAANHPETLHLDSNIWDVEPRAVTGGRPVGLLWASPDCKHFSKAKGGAPRDRNIRDLAWVIVRWAEDVRPDVIIMENVEEFVTWGPVDDEGEPIKWLAGHTFEDWKRRLKKAGYKLQHRELRACDYGAPTIRKRFFLIARRDGRRIVWPAPTHGNPKSAAVKAGKLLPWRTAAEIIDWSLPCPSIFASSPEIKAQYGLRAIRPLADATMARIARGVRRYVLDAERPFLVNLTHGAREEDVAEPLRTVTGANRGEKAVVAPSLMSLKGADRRGRDALEPHSTVLAGGGHSALVAPSLTRFNGNATGADLRGPAPTVTANSFIKRPGGAAPLGVIAPHLMTMRNSGKPYQGADEPTHTITAGGAGLTLVSPILSYAQQGGRNRDPLDPLHTICASSKDQNALIAAALIQTGYGERSGQEPRALDLGAPLGTVVAGGAKHAPIAAFLAQQNTGMVGHDARKPMSTIVDKGCTQTPVAAFIARHFGNSVGHGAGEPCGTITAGGQGKSAPVAAWLSKWYGSPQDPRLDDPLHTVTTKPRFDVEQAKLAAPPFSAEHEARARQVADFLRAHDAWDEREFVSLEIDGDTFVIVDIGMRMLTPRELFRAQGFPADYVIEGVWSDESGEWAWRPFPLHVQTSCVGNSVCPPLAEALVGANCEHLVAAEEAA